MVHGTRILFTNENLYAPQTADFFLASQGKPPKISYTRSS